MNDLAGLRAAIIASCTIRATQELRQGPLPLTFLVPVRGYAVIDLLVTLGGEIRDAAFRLGAGPFTLAGIDHEEILGVRLQVFQVDPVVLGFGLLVISIGRLRRLAEIVGVSAIADNGAAAGVCGPGYHRPCGAYALDAWTVDDFHCRSLWPDAWVLRWQTRPEPLPVRLWSGTS